MAGCCGGYTTPTDSGMSSTSSKDPKDLGAIPPLATIGQDLGFKCSPLALPKECCTEFVLPKGKAKCGLVWMHGLGDDESGWADMLESEFQVPAALGPCKFILPRAPRQRSSCNDGEVLTSWFDIARLPISRRSAPLHGCSVEEALASCGRVHAAIDKLVSDGIPAKNIIVGGFSQGGAMALLSTLTYPQQLGGTIVFSGICFYPDLVTKLAQYPQNQGLQVFWGHGTRDEILRADLQDEGVEILQKAGLNVTAKKYMVDHGPTEQEIKDAAGFFAAALK